MNKCPRCNKVLVTCKTAIALEGKLYCSIGCAKLATVDDEVEKAQVAHVAGGEKRTYNACFKTAMDRYEAGAEEVSTQDVLSEDLQDVQVAVTIYKTVKVPKTLTEQAAKERVEKLWSDCKLAVDYDNCDDVQFECMLIK